MQVNVKKSKSSEKHVLCRDDGRFNPTLSNKPSTLNYISEIICTSHNPECSNSKGSKRNSSFDDNRKSKKICRTKSMQETSLLNCNPNEIIDSNCQNSNIENIFSRLTLNNDNSVRSDPYSSDLEINSNVLYKHTADGFNQKLSPNKTGLSIKNKSTLIQPNQQSQNLSNFIAPGNLSPTIQSGSETINEKTQIQSRADHSFESISRTEPTDHQEMYSNTKIPSQSKESSTSLSFAELQLAYDLFIDGKLILCIYPKCTNSHHFHVSLSKAETLRHNLTVRFDYFRYHIHNKYKELLISNPRESWSNIPVLGQLTERCLCKDCCEIDCTINLNQKILRAYYIKGRIPSIEEDNCENKLPTNRKILFCRKSHLAKRFITENYLENHSISQMTDHMKRHIKQPTILKMSMSLKKQWNLRFITENYFENHSISQMTDHIKTLIKHFKYATQLFQQIPYARQGSQCCMAASMISYPPPPMCETGSDAPEVHTRNENE